VTPGNRIVVGTSALRTLLLLVAVLPHARAQTTEAPPTATKPGPKPLTKAELEQRMKGMREGLIEKLVPEKVKKGDPQKRKKWLDAFFAIQSQHYLLFTNSPPSSGDNFAKSLERLYAFVKKAFPFEDTDHLLECFVFADPEEYYDFCVKVTGWSPEAARATAGHASGAYYATYYQSPSSDVVMHEATHQIVHACLHITGVGSWFQEGMAVYVENKIGNVSPSSSMRSRMKNKQVYPLEQFVAIPTLLSDGDKGHENYEQAGALIDFLVNTKLEKLAGKFPEFLRAARGAGFGRDRDIAVKLFQTVYGMTLAEVDAAWRKHHGL